MCYLFAAFCRIYAIFIATKSPDDGECRGWGVKSYSISHVLYYVENSQQFRWYIV